MKKTIKREASMPFQGLSLVELLITITIVSIIAAMAAPNYQSLIEKKHLSGAAEAIYSQLQFARSEAIKQSASMTVTFSSSSNPWCSGLSTQSCDCTKTNPNETDACSVLVDGSNNVLKVVNGGSFKGTNLGASSASSVTFNGVRGTTGQNSSIYIQSSSLSKEIKIEINAIGRVRICTPAGSEATGAYPSC